MCLTGQPDSSARLPVSDATRQRRDPLTLGLSPFEAGRRVCEVVGSRTTGFRCVVPRSSLEAQGRNVLSLIGVERIGLETDLVRRPRVRGTAPLATVGKERRLSLCKKNAFIGARLGSLVVVSVSSVVPRVFLTKQVVVGSRSFFRCLPG